MAMTIKTDGLTELSEMLTQLGNQAENVAKKALYNGAGIVADAFARATESIRTEPFEGKREKRLPSPEEKAILIGRTGIAKFNVTGSEVDTLVGLTEAGGYAYIGHTKKAVRMIARSINTGTSFMDKQPVYRKAKSQSQQGAVKAIVDTAEKMFDEIINGSG